MFDLISIGVGFLIGVSCLLWKLAKNCNASFSDLITLSFILLAGIILTLVGINQNYKDMNTVVIEAHKKGVELPPRYDEFIVEYKVNQFKKTLKKK